MRKFLLLLCGCFITAVLAAQVHTVSSIPGLADYASLDEAINAANSGDTVYLYPGTYSLVEVLNKPIAIVGPGYRRSQNGFTNENMDSRDAQVQNFNVLAELGGQCAIIGCSINGINISDADNVTVDRCYVTGNVSVTNSGNIDFTRNFITDPCGSPVYSFRVVATSGLVFYNNIFEGCQSVLEINQNSSGMILHNVFGGSSISFEVYNSFVKNNIFTRAGNNGFSFNNSIVTYNLKYVNDCFGAFCQVYTSNPFVSSASSYSFDGRYQLTPTSVARGAGENGVDCGVSGGDFPYQLSGLPAIPLIYDLELPDNVPAGTPMNVNVKVRTQN